MKSAHKDTEHPAGQIVNRPESNVPKELTLGDYIKRITRSEQKDMANIYNEEATSQAPVAKKMTFDEWFEKEHKDRNWLYNDLKIAMYNKLMNCWIVAQENKNSL